MRKPVSAVLALTIAGVCCVIAAYFCRFYYFRYRDTVTDLESRINSFDMRLATLEAHKSRELTPVRVWGYISTTDRPAEQQMHWYTSSEKHPDGYFEIINAKGGALVRPELRLPVGSTNYEYTIQISSQFGTATDAWLSHVQPYQDLAAFDEFRAYCAYETNAIRLVARPRPGASIQTRFELVLLCLK